MSGPDPGGPLRAAGFLDWAAAQPSGRFELVEGYVCRHERPPAAATRALADAARSFASALRRAGVAGRVFPGGVPVRVDDATVLSPDLVVGDGGALLTGGVAPDRPVIVIECLHPRRSPLDDAARAALYLRAPGVFHVVMIDAGARCAHWGRRGADGRPLNSRRRTGALRFDPPGVEVLAEDLFLTD